MKILFLGDVFGSCGRSLIKKHLPVLKQDEQVSFCIANCENAAQGRGITENTARELFAAGVDVLTSGNHLWDKRDGLEYIAREPRLLKPANYPEEAPGQEAFITDAPGGKLAVFCLCGQVFMDTPYPPLFTLERLLEKYGGCRYYLVDFHAEATGEKRSLGLYFDGKLTAIVGTHTHVQTADEEILPGGTAYLTDCGMTGPHNSVIGIEKEIIFKRMRTGLPQHFHPAEGGAQINGVVVDVDDSTGLAVGIKRIRRLYDGC